MIGAVLDPSVFVNLLKISLRPALKARALVLKRPANAYPNRAKSNSAL
jgi:hypothetical protein